MKRIRPSLARRPAGWAVRAVIVLLIAASFTAACQGPAAQPPTIVAQAPTNTSAPPTETATLAPTLTPTAAPTETAAPSATPTPEPAPTIPPRRPRPNGALLFEDDFSAAVPLAKPLFTEEYMSYQAVGGRGLLSSAYAGEVMPVLYAEEQPANFLLEVEFRAPAAAAGSGYGVVFRSDAAAEGLDYYYLVEVRPAEDRLLFRCWQSGAWLPDQEAALPADLLNDNGFNRIRLEAVGRDFGVFINDAPVFSGVDDAFAGPGILGLALVPGSAMAAGEEDLVYFDNLRVYAASPTLAAVAAAPSATSTMTATITATLPSALAAPAATAAAAPATAPAASPSPRSNATAQPRATAAPARLPDFESTSTWVRGNQPYGAFERSTEQKKTGSYSGRLSYDFPAVASNFVVFEPRPAIPLPGKPTGITAWVYGDGSGHFLNIWLRDAGGERRSYTFGPVGQAGWQQMTAWLDDTRGWPNGHIDGPDNGRLDFPASLAALVLDGVPDGQASRGIIYMDDLGTTTEPMVSPTVAPTASTEAGPAPAPTAEPQSAAAVLAGRIAVPIYAPDRATYDIYIVDPTCGCMDRVIDDASQPALSPDGRRLAFRRWKSDDRGVVVMDTYGGNQKRLSNFLEDALPTWSPDGRYLIFSSRRESDRQSRIYGVEVAGGSDWQLQRDGGPVYGQYPAWAANNRVIYHTDWPDVGIAAMNPDGAGFAQTVADGSATAPSPAPDGQAVAYMSLVGGSWDIYRVSVAGMGPVRLTENGANDGLPAWSPDGRSIAFLSDRSGAWALWVMNADGGAQRKLVDLPGPPDGRVRQEPDFSTRGWTDERISWAP